MQTDRELLEMAAKAAGGKLCDTLPGYPFWAHFPGNPAGPWDPLADDADAFRLAVKLRLSITRYDNLVEIDDIEQGYSGDWLADTRRAIVRAAAAIGASL